MSASSRRLAGSRLDDGSSSTRISGCMASTVATATRRRWPNDRWCGGRSAYSAIPTCVERIVDPRVQLGALEAQVGGAERYVVGDRRHEQLVVGVLEHQADPAADLRPRCRLPTRSPATSTLPVAGLEDAVEVQHQRGLAGPVRPEQRDPLAARDGQVDAEQRLVSVGVGIGEVAHLEHWLPPVIAHDHAPTAATPAERQQQADRPVAGTRRGLAQTGQRAGIAARQHRQVHPLAALVGADEEGAGTVGEDGPVPRVARPRSRATRGRCASGAAGRT